MFKNEQGKLEQKVEELEAKLAKHSAVKMTPEEIEQLKTEHTKYKLDFEELTKNHNQLEKTLIQEKAEYEKTIRNLNEKYDKNVLESEKEYNEISQKSSRDKDRILEYKKRQRESTMTIRKMHNTILGLKGNIRVFCRVRPFIDNEEPTGVFKFSSTDKQKISLLTNGKNRSVDFFFDSTFGPGATQQDIFSEVSELIESALYGYSVCIFAYGQTNSGKTYTMEGTPNIPHRLGIIPRAITKLFSEIKNLKQQGWTYDIQISILEIYNEEIHDLLGDAETPLKIRYANTKKHSKKGSVEIVNLTKTVVTEESEVYPLIKKAKKNRSVGSTSSNANSSRSHSVFTVHLVGKNEQERQTLRADLNLVDLAGSERLKQP
eukprot:UN34687